MSTKSKRRKRSWIWGVIAAAVVVIVSVGIVLWTMDREEDPPETVPTNPVQVDNAQKVAIGLDYGLQIVDVARYTGVYMEDGKDDIVSGTLMIVVKNAGTADIQYAEIEMPVGDQTARFTLSTLPAGESVTVLEANRMRYDTGASYTTASAVTVAPFSQSLSLFRDKLEIQMLDGALNVTNISGEDMTDDVTIYYKNSASDMLYGGITYRVCVTGGLKSGETKQVMAGHYTVSGSRIMFISCG